MYQFNSAFRAATLNLVVMLGVIGCGGEIEGDYTISGNVFNLQGTIQLSNGDDVVTVTGEGDTPFRFPKKMFSGDSYDVLVSAHPDSQRCTSAQNTGQVLDEDISDVIISCSGGDYAINGYLVNLQGTIQLSNGDDVVTVTGEGDTPFSFPKKMFSGDNYDVLVSAHPDSQRCTSAQNTGQVLDEDISDVIISCSGGDYAISGYLVNLQGTIQLSNGDDVVTVTGEGDTPFSFPKKMFSGDNYDVLVSAHPDTQLCDPVNNTGLVVDIDISYVIISCTAAYKIGGTINDLQEPISLALNDHIELLPLANGDTQFQFKTKLLPTELYKVDFGTKPQSQICRLEDRKGVIEALDIVSINLHCEAGRKLGGYIDGLSGVIQLSNNGNTLTADTNGEFSFSGSYFEGEGYNVFISEQPTEDFCSVTQGSGFFAGEDVNSPRINCIPRTSLPPSISSIWPTVLWPSAEAKLSGVHLGNSTLTINGAVIDPSYVDDNEIRFNTPDLAAGDYVIEVNSQNGGDQSNVVVKAPIKAKSLSAGVGITCAIDPEDDVYCWPISAPEGLFQLVSNPEDGRLRKLNIGKVKKISFLNPFHACALKMDGKVLCWGNNANGQLGVNTNDYGYIPMEVSGLNDVVDVSAGNFHTCAVTSNGSAYCWGYLEGMGSQTLPLKVPGVENAVQVVSGGYHACFRTDQHQVYCWGDNFSGQLGVGSDIDNTATPIAINFPFELIDIDSTHFSTCALDVLGYVRCWGDNSNYIIGAQYSSGRFYYTPTTATYLSKAGINGISLGGDHGCANHEDGTVSCWGSNREGQFGIGVTSPSESSLSYQVLNLNGVTSIAASSRYTCALLSNQTVKCWAKLSDSDNDSRSPTRDSFTPTGLVTVSGIDNVRSIKANQNSIFVVDRDDDLSFWGLGRWSIASSSAFTHTPVTPFELTDVASIDLAEGACIHQLDGEVRCWGGYYNGRNYSEASPEVVAGLTSSSVVKGDRLKCALFQDQSVSCWSEFTNNAGINRQLTPILGLEPIIDLDVHYNHACMLDIYGDVFCISLNSSIVPEQVIGLPKSSKIVITGSHSCAITNNGDVYCWGGNHAGQLGTTGIASSTIPLKIEGVSAAAQLFTHGSGACAKTAHSDVICWGNRNLDVDTAEPRLDTDFKDVDTIVSPSTDLVCSLLNNDRVQCRGQHRVGVLGLDGGYLEPNYPILHQ
ncbi:IPT/TIG domain-containing protein [Ketobacter alkanivorans]|uniref:IPT/TIG domain-containing protein n=1 Tax=Ketobacter alkanivorans TaxID=1917421 RepID=A0A2K9LKD5_9GAMM|nr:IPT/TIG domain-containing protein [Ketobacter alkanivorans]AUM12819.1 hypothetical protein Kalk_10485 [Ketobacter alkanivorans]